MPGYEVNVLYLAGFLSLVISGAGRMTVPPLGEAATPPEYEVPEQHRPVGVT
jgi:hypothetical protein